MFTALWVFSLGLSTLLFRTLAVGTRIRHWWWLWFLGGLLFLIVREISALQKHALGMGSLAALWDASGPNLRGGEVGGGYLVLLGFAHLSVLVCWIGTLRHCLTIHKLRSGSDGPVADLVLDIVLFPVAFGTLATHAARMHLAGRPWTADADFGAAENFESWALASVFTIFEYKTRPGGGGHPLLRLGVNQFLLVNAVSSGVVFGLQGFHPCSLCYALGDSSCHELHHRLEAPFVTIFGMPFGILGSIVFVSSSIALTAIVKLERKYHTELQGIDPHNKFFGVKILVSVVFMQPYALHFLSKGTILPLLAGIDPNWLNAWLLSSECVFLHLYHVRFAYPARDFVTGGSMCVSSPLAPVPSTAPDDPEIRPAAREDSSRSRIVASLWGLRERLAVFCFGFPMFLVLVAALGYASSNSCDVHAVPHAKPQRRARYICDRVNIECAGGYAFPNGVGSAPGVCTADGRFRLDGSGDVAVCSTCAPGYVGWPQCERCTSERHCGGRAVRVKADPGGERCLCQCSRRYSGPHCEHCAEAFEGPECGRCSPGHFNFPTCVRCSTGKHCHGHGTAVTDDGTRTRCLCTCADRWQGEACGQCATGRTGFPSCLSVLSKSGCVCQAEWQHCSFLGLFGCTTERGCAVRSTKGNEKWCKTEGPCKSNWDQC
eukprot:Hpha_TRINITY_DN34011_c0_g1::TRINITY_DN34011_c0_g1_i1::g.30612::m.30612